MGAPAGQGSGSPARAPRRALAGAARFVASHPSVDWAALAALAVLVYGMLLVPGRIPFSPASDFVQYAWPLKQILYDSLRDGTGIPFWRLDQMSGMPALTQPQSLYTHPLHLLYWLLPPPVAVGPTMWLELLTAGLGAWALGAALGLSRPARFVMGVAQLTSFRLMLVAWAGWEVVLPALCWLPWLLAAWIDLARRPGRGAVVRLAAAAALAFHAGTLQPYYYAVLFFGPWIVWRAVDHARAGRARDARTVLLGSAAAGLLGFAASAYLWIPILADLPLLSRGQLDYHFFLSGHHLELASFGMLLDPEFLGTPRLGNFARVELWEESLYFGIVPLALALVGAAAGRPRRTAVYLAAVAVATIALGFDTPLLEAFYRFVPGFSFFRIPTRALFLGALAVTALAGLGWDVAARALRDTRLRRVALALVVLVTAGDGAWRAHQYLTTWPPISLEPALPVARALPRDGEPYRTVVIGAPVLSYAWTQALGLELVTGYEPYGFAHYRRYLGRLETGGTSDSWAGSRVDLRHVERLDMLDALNVRFAISGHRLDLGEGALGEGWREVRTWPRHPRYLFGSALVPGLLTLYERTDPLRRAWLVDHVVTTVDGEDAEATLDGIDLRDSAVVVSAEAPPTDGRPDPGDAVRDIDDRAGHLRFSTHTAGTRFVAVSEVWHPGWSARLDGRPVALLRTDGALLGLFVPPGDHEVELDFRPTAFGPSLVVSAVALFALAACGVLAALSGRGGRAGRGRAPGGP